MRSPAANSRSGDGEPLAAEAAVAVHERAGERVELGDVAAAQRDHDVAGEVVAGVLPTSRRAGASRVVSGSSETTSGRASRRRRGSRGRAPLRIASSASPLGSVALAAVLAELDRAVTFDDAGEEAAGADGGELVRVADQDVFPLRLLDAFEQRREDARLGHAGLVDDEHGSAAGGRRRGCCEQPVERGRGDAGLVLELLGGDAGRCGADHRDAALRERRRRRRAWRSSCPRRRARRRRRRGSGSWRPSRSIVACSRGERSRVARSVSSSRLAVTAGASAARPRSTSASAARSVASSSPVE